MPQAVEERPHRAVPAAGQAGGDRKNDVGRGKVRLGLEVGRPTPSRQTQPPADVVLGLGQRRSLTADVERSMEHVHACLAPCNCLQPQRSHFPQDHVAQDSAEMDLRAIEVVLPAGDFSIQLAGAPPLEDAQQRFRDLRRPRGRGRDACLGLPQDFGGFVLVAHGQYRPPHGQVVKEFAGDDRAHSGRDDQEQHRGGRCHLHGLLVGQRAVFFDDLGQRRGSATRPAPRR